jgi:hypothetical protein
VGKPTAAAITTSTPPMTAIRPPSVFATWAKSAPPTDIAAPMARSTHHPPPRPRAAGAVTTVTTTITTSAAIDSAVGNSPNRTISAATAATIRSTCRTLVDVVGPPVCSRDASI